jgi:HlyD family secretion protein
MMKKKIRLIAIVLIVVLIGAGGTLIIRSLNNKTPANELVLYGNIDIRQVELAFNANERIASMTVQEGDRIKKGQLLATLDTLRLSHEVSQAEAQVKAQKEVLAALEAGTRPEDIRKAQADVAAAEAEQKNAEVIFSRKSRLAEEELIPAQQRDDARAAADFSQAQLTAAKEALALAVAGPRKEDIAAARETLRAYEAALSIAKRNLEYAYLYAPSDGVIQTRILEPGNMASPQTPVFTLALTDPVWVRAYVPEPDMGKIRLGMSAEVTTDSYPGKRYKAWIGFISPTAEFTPKSVETREVRTNLVYQVRVYACNHDNELRLGMPATVIVPLNQTDTRPDAGRPPEEDPCKDNR